MPSVEDYLPTVAKPACKFAAGDASAAGPHTSWFGAAPLAMPGLDWPLLNDEPMWAFFQIVVSELPVVPPSLEGVAVVQCFVEDELVGDNYFEGDSRHLIREFPSLDALQPKRGPRTATEFTPCPMAWQRIDDHPHPDDLPRDRLDDDAFYIAYGKAKPCEEGTKVGGYPFIIHEDETDPSHFALQIGVMKDWGWMYYDGGIARFYRLAANRWTCHSDSY